MNLRVKRITFNDRKLIEKLFKENKSVQEVSEATGFHITTIYKELKRGGDPYSAETAQHSI